MDFVQIATEQTTAFTDLISGIFSLLFAILLIGKKGIRVNYWKWFFVFLSVAAFAGAIVHGLLISQVIRELLWGIIYFSLGIGMAFMALTSLPISLIVFFVTIGIGILFFIFAAFIFKSFLVFVIYSAAILIFSFFNYLFKFVKKRKLSLLIMCLGILVMISSGIVQALIKGEFQFIWIFDHNGLAHIVQTTGTLILYLGLAKSYNMFQK